VRAFGLVPDCQFLALVFFALVSFFSSSRALGSVPDYQFLALMFFTLISFFLCVQASYSLPYVSATFLMKYVLRQNIYIYTLCVMFIVARSIASFLKATLAS
jgi:hypothetical protein